MLIVTIILVFVSFLSIFSIKLYFKSAFPNGDCTSQEVIGTMPLSEAITKLTSQEQINCYCRQQGIDSILTDSDLQNYCEAYISSMLDASLFNFTVSSCIVFVNFLLKISIQFLSKYERFQRKTRKRVYMMTKLFIAIFINTAISTLIANFNVVSEQLSMLGTGSKFEDIDREWYNEVGVTIIVTMIVSVFCPHVFQLVFSYPYGVCKKNAVIDFIKANTI